MEAHRDDGVIGERLTVEELTTLYAAAEADIVAAMGSIHAALGRVNAAFMGAERGFNARLTGRGCHHGFDGGDVEEAVKELRRSVWRSIVERAAVRRAMSVRAWKELQDRLERDVPPPVTAANVAGMLDQFQADIPDMLNEAVTEVFDFLRPPGSRYKTNTEFEIGEKVILTSGVERGWSTWDTGSWRDQQLVALENVLQMLDGKPRPVEGYYSAVALEIKRIPAAEPCHGATPLMEFRGYKNGSLHLRFRRLDLNKKLNAIAGGARLRSEKAA